MSARGAVRAIAFLLFVLLPLACAPKPRPRPVVAPPPPPKPVALVPEVDPWPRREVLDLAFQAYRCAELEGRFQRRVLTVIDYSLPANQPRLWVIDLDGRRVLHHDLVAHGERSGGTQAVAFSNELGSHQSSLGLFRTDEIYTGQFGYSLRLSGLEPGINDNARARAIVIHGMADVSREYAARYRTIPTSWGCPALPPETAAPVIDQIANGSALFAYYPDAAWLRESRYLHCGAQFADASDSFVR